MIWLLVSQFKDKVPSDELRWSVQSPSWLGAVSVVHVVKSQFLYNDTDFCMSECLFLTNAGVDFKPAKQWQCSASVRTLAQENADFPYIHITFVLLKLSHSMELATITVVLREGRTNRRTQSHTEFKTHSVWPKEFISQTHYCELSVLSFQFQSKVFKNNWNNNMQMKKSKIKKES